VSQWYGGIAFVRTNNYDFVVSRLLTQLGKIEKQKRKRTVESKKLFSIDRLMFDRLVYEMVMPQPLYIVERLRCIHGIQ
jgi:hypothetical protein